MPIELRLGEPVHRLTPEEEREKRRSRRFWTWAISILTVLLLVVVLRLFAFESTLIISGSMEPTLYRGDYALFDHRVALRSRWNRGDVVVFKAPSTWESAQGQTLVKRVIGLPGETLTMTGGVVYINGVVLQNQDYIKEAPRPDFIGPLKLGANEYYVLGDNRNNSDDSRANGPVGEEDVQGRILMRLWPPGRIGGLPQTNYGERETNF